MADTNWIVLADDRAIEYFRPSDDAPDDLRILVGEIKFRWANEPPPEEPEPEPPVLQPYSQRDPRWKDLEYAPGYTFGAAGCYVVAIAMMLSLGGYDEDPVTVARRIRDTIPGAFVNGELIKPQELQNLYPQMEWAGKLDWTHTAADMDRVDHELERGPVIMQVDFKPGGTKDSHFVVAEGFTADSDDRAFEPSAGDLFIIDPWDGARTRLLERYALDHWNLARAIYGLRLLRVADH